MDLNSEVQQAIMESQSQLALQLKTKPRTKLEVIGNRSVMSIIAFMFGIPLLICVLLVLERDVVQSKLTKTGPPCVDGVPTKDCTQQRAGGNETLWSTTLDQFNILSGVWSLNMILEGDEMPTSQPLRVEVGVHVVCVLAENRRTVLPPLRKNNTTVTGGDSTGGWWRVERNVTCRESSGSRVLCSPALIVPSFALLDEGGVSDGILMPYGDDWCNGWELSVVLFNKSDVKFDSATYTFVFRNFVWALMSGVFRTLAAMVTLGTLVWNWFKSRRSKELTRAEPQEDDVELRLRVERALVTGLMIVSLLLQNPFSLLLLYYGGAVAGLSSLLLRHIAMSVMMGGLLIILDGIKPGSYHGSLLRFYGPKVTFSVLLLTVWVLATAAQYCQVNSDHPKTYDCEDYRKLYNLMSGLSVFLQLSWVVWLLWLMRTTGVALTQLPYLQYRYCHLMFSYVTLEICAILLEVLTANLAYYFSGADYAPNNTIGYSNFLTTCFPALECLWISCIVLRMYYVYQDAARSGRKSSSNRQSIIEDQGATGMGADGESQMMIFVPELATWLFEVARQMYHNLEEKGVRSKASNGEAFDLAPIGLEAIDTSLNEELDTFSCVAATADRKAVVVAFRGSQSWTNYLTDIQFVFEPFSHPDWKLPHELFQPQVHTGFWTAYKSVREPLLAAVRPLMASASPATQLYVTGHSLGAAMATLASFDLSVVLDTKVCLYTFGSPRVGNRSFAKIFEDCVPWHYRVVHDGDAVTGVPKLLKLYKHVGREVLIDDIGNVVLNPTPVERVLRKGIKSSFNNHARISYKAGLDACQLLNQEANKQPPSNSRARIHKSRVTRTVQVLLALLSLTAVVSLSVLWIYAFLKYAIPLFLVPLFISTTTLSALGMWGLKRHERALHVKALLSPSSEAHASLCSV